MSDDLVWRPGADAVPPPSAELQGRPVAPVVAVDIGNVCFRIEPERSLRALGFRDFAEIRRQAPQLLAWGHALETGELTLADFVARAGTLLPAPITEAQAADALNSLIREEIPGMGQQVERLVDLGYRPVFLSDIAPPQYAHVRRELSFAHLIPEAVVSYEVGATKPHAAMYERFEREHCEGGVPALYIDDRANNVAAAEGRGWRAITFRDTPDLSAALDALGPVA